MRTNPVKEKELPRTKQPKHQSGNALAKAESLNKDLLLQIKKHKTIEQNLMKFQRLNDTILHNFPDGVIGVLNRKMEYVLIDGKDLNEIDLPSLGFRRPGVQGTNDSALAEDIITKIKKAFEGRSVSFEAKANDRFYDISAVPLPDENNKINEILCVLRNVTQRKQLEDGLLKALEKEKELGELKSRFITMTSHEFKTPLATILSSSFLLERYSGKDYANEKLLHTSRIRNSVRNLTSILNEFLSLEKLEENKVKVVYQEINLTQYLRDIIAEFDSIKKEGQTIDYQPMKGKQTAFLDPNLLWSIFNNLISNALKYSKTGDTTTITSEIKNDMITITVKDTGIGIPPHEHKHIFASFYRASNAVNIEGTGLGLLIAEKNVILLNGSITFTSQLGCGTEFTVILPDGHKAH